MSEIVTRQRFASSERPGGGNGLSPWRGPFGAIRSGEPRIERRRLALVARLLAAAFEQGQREEAADHQHHEAGGDEAEVLVDEAP